MRKKGKTKDLLFNTIDYVVMIVIILGIVVILGHKFELLFNKGKVDNELAETKDGKSEVNLTSEDLNNKDSENSNENTAITSDAKDVEEKDTTEIDLTGTDNTSDQGTQTSDITNADNKDNVETKPADTTPQATGEEIKISIPNGTLPGGIGEILANAGLISSKEDFINKAVELKLDRKLRSGEFTFKKGQSLEEIIRIIAK